MSNAYPQKFILSPEQHKGYVDARRAGVVGVKTNVSERMGVLVEVTQSTPGVMIAADGREITMS